MVVIDMNEKVRIPIVTDTVLVDGCYQEERRFGEERRKNKRGGDTMNVELIQTRAKLVTSQ